MIMKTKHTKELPQAQPKVVDNQWQVENHLLCDDCQDELVFIMKSGKEEFALGLKTVIQCLSIAQNELSVPPLPDDWWNEVYNRHFS